jgi:hypothetical protein
MAALALSAASNMDWAVQAVCLWLLGVALGLLLPKPKWADRGLKAALLSTPPGLWARRVAVAAHLSLIVREVWRNLFAPGTFRGVLRNAWRTLTTGTRFEWPLPAAASASAGPAPPTSALADSHTSWHITSKDLDEFKWTIDEDGGPEGASQWEPMMDKHWPGCAYTAWRRTLPSGKSEYKSVTVSEDATAEEFMDFYLDDEARMKWDSMITETQLLETAPGDARCQVVRWLRTFPFSFISQREYVIARRVFREPDGSLIAITRGLVEHPEAPREAGKVRMEAFLSCWRSRTVPCPQGSERPAVETTLLHFEDFRINERLARFAVRHGMAGFVKGMIPAVQAFVAERRQRCGPHAEDRASFGFRQLALPAPAAAPLSPAPSSSLLRSASLASTAGSLDWSSRGSAFVGGEARRPARSASGASLVGDDSASELGSSLARSPSMRRLGAMMLASGVAIALARTASVPSLPAAAAGASSRRAGGSGSHVAAAGSSASGRHGSGSSPHGHHGKRHGSGQRRHGGHGYHRRRQQQEPAAVPASA